MKKIIKLGFLASILSLVSISCNDRRDDNTNVTIAKIKIDSVKIAQDTMDAYTVQSIRTYSTYLSGCYGFEGYNYVHDNLTRTVTAYSWKTDGACSQSISTHYNQFNFHPQQSGTYTFKFWKGDGNYITKTIVVE